MTSDSFKNGKAGYERVTWCFKDRLNLTFDLMVAWKPAKGRPENMYYNQCKTDEMDGDIYKLEAPSILKVKSAF